jgi:hypothetical protein
MAGDRSKATEIGRALGIVVDVAAVVAFGIFVAKFFLWPLYALIDLAILGHRSGGYPLSPIVTYLCLLGLPWLVRRYGARIVSFFALVVTSNDADALVSQATQWLFAILDVVSWISISVVVAATAWLIFGSTAYLPFDTRVPLQLHLVAAFLPLACIGGTWLLMRSDFGKKMFLARFREALAQAEELERESISPSPSEK